MRNRQERNWALAILAVSVFFFIFLFIQTNSTPITYPNKAFSNFWKKEKPEPLRTDPLAPITVLIWDFGSDEHPFHNWAGLGSGNELKVPNYVGHDIKKQCSLECRFTTDKQKLSTVDAILFESQPREPGKIWDWLRDPITLPQKRSGQLWVQFGTTNPLSYPLLSHAGYVKQFDVNMTLDQSSQVPISLFCKWGGADISSILEPPPPKTKGLVSFHLMSDKRVIFVEDNCGIGEGARKRALYVEQLSKHIPVDSFGLCLHSKDFPKGFPPNTEKSRREYLQQLLSLISDYQFFLAFEDANLTDHVTERLMLGFQAGTLPVYMGAPNVQDWLPGDNSIVRIDDFSGPKELAKQLDIISDSPSRYASYFAWKKRGLTRKFQEKADRCVMYNNECRLCQQISAMKQKMSNNANNVVRDSSHALRFNGNNWVEIGHHNDYDLQTQFTIGAWIQLDDIQDYRIVDKSTEGKIDGYSIDVLRKGNRGFLRLCAAGGCWMAMKPLNLRSWYFITVKYISGKAAAAAGYDWCGVQFYINGELDYTVKFFVAMHSIGTIQKNTHPLRIGRAGNGNAFFRGMIDDVSIWNVPLEPERIRTLMYERLGGNEPGLVGYWDFNEGTGSLLRDQSSKKHHGTLYENQLWVHSEEKPLILNHCK